MKIRAMALALSASVAWTGAANAAVFNFTGGGGNLGKSATFTNGPDSISAIAINTEEPGPRHFTRTGSGSAFGCRRAKA